MQNVARFFRLTARVLLSMGAIFSVGIAMLLIYAAIGGGKAPGDWIPIELPQGGEGATGPIIRTSNLIWAIIVIAIFGVGLGLTIKRLNSFVRSHIAKIAKWLGIGIFPLELILGAGIWGIGTVILIFYMPLAAILTGSLLVATEVCFLLARLFYGRKKYTI